MDEVEKEIRMVSDQLDKQIAELSDSLDKQYAKAVKKIQAGANCLRDGFIGDVQARK